MRVRATGNRRARLLNVAILPLAASVVLGASPALAGVPYKVLYTFAGGSDGSGPQASLAKDNTGNLYGTTVNGGAAGAGTVFKLAPDGKETVLYTFKGASDGGNPYGSLILDKAGDLYGTTAQGGNTGCYDDSNGCGVVFKLAPDGTETVLYTFMGFGVGDGAVPFAGLIQDSAGNLYGTTYVGGAHDYGAVFKLAPDGTETVIYSFANSSTGVNPRAGVIRDKSGNLYGTTVNGSNGTGVAYEVAPDGTETLLYSFNGGNDGGVPYAGLIQDKAGNFYGTTSGGGAHGVGTVFEILPNGFGGWKEMALYSFTGGSDGATPNAGVIADSSGNLYGTTSKGGGADGFGTVFKLAPEGSLTVLYVLGGSAGGTPTAGLIKDSVDGKGDLFGTASTGGTNGDGVVFRVKE